VIPHRVVLSPEAEAHLESIYLYIAADASPEIARRYTEAITRRCAGLAIFPHRGTPREDLRAGIRTLAFRRRSTIVDSVEPGEVTILGIFYAGLDYEALVRKS
jgi:plasmid stabilization system protein ParE